MIPFREDFKVGRYQAIWWSWEFASWGLPHRPNPAGGMALIYDWWGFHIGPVEIRRWRKQ